MPAYVVAAHRITDPGKFKQGGASDVSLATIIVHEASHKFANTLDHAYVDNELYRQVESSRNYGTPTATPTAPHPCTLTGLSCESATCQQLAGCSRDVVPRRPMPAT